MTRSNIAALVAGLLALVGLALGAYGLYRSANAQNQMTTLQATLAADAETNQVVLDRLGIATLQPAQATDAANVARDPADVPPPITRTAPTTVQVTLDRSLTRVNSTVSPSITRTIGPGTVPSNVQKA